MNKLILAIVLCVTALFFTNCDKNDNPPPSNTDYITKSSWKFSSAKAGGTDVTSQVPTCFKDNTMLFVANGTGTINESTNICTPASPATFTWVFQTNGTEINLNTPLVSGGSGVFKIVLLNDVSMVVSQNITIAPAPSTNVELTFIH